MDSEIALDLCNRVSGIAELLAVLLAVHCFAVGLLLWRLFVLSKSQRNIL